MFTEWVLWKYHAPTAVAEEGGAVATNLCWVSAPDEK
jgi:hypothetical protein